MKSEVNPNQDTRNTQAFLVTEFLLIYIWASFENVVIKVAFADTLCSHHLFLLAQVSNKVLERYLSLSICKIT